MCACQHVNFSLYVARSCGNVRMGRAHTRLSLKSALWSLAWLPALYCKLYSSVKLYGNKYSTVATGRRAPFPHEEVESGRGPDYRQPTTGQSTGSPRLLVLPARKSGMEPLLNGQQPHTTPADNRSRSPTRRLDKTLRAITASWREAALSWHKQHAPV